jgi:hypothetical protein
VVAVDLFGPQDLLNGLTTNPILMANTSVTVTNAADNSAATLYTDNTGTSTTTNIISTNSQGLLSFYAVAGWYKLAYTNAIGAQTRTVEVGGAHDSGSYPARPAGSSATAAPIPMLNVVDFGADPAGVANSTAAILAACQAAFTTLQRGNRPAYGVWVPAGQYKINSLLDFSTLTATGLQDDLGASNVSGFHFLCAPGAVFVWSGGTNSNAVKIAPPSGMTYFTQCTFRFGSIIDNARVAGTNGLYVTGLRQSVVEAEDVFHFGGHGVYLAGTATQVFNNVMRFGELSTCSGYGIATDGGGGVSDGVQGNEIHVQRPVSNTLGGICLDVAGTGQQSKWNTWHIGAAEFNTGPGIVDKCGLNNFLVANSNSNSLGYELISPSNGPSTVVGYVTDGINLHGQACAVTNTGVHEQAAVKHLIASGSAPTIAVGSAAGTGAAAAAITGKDSGGLIHITIGTAPGTGTLFTVTFNQPFVVAPSAPPAMTRASPGGYTADTLYVAALSATQWAVTATAAITGDVWLYYGPPT